MSEFDIVIWEGTEEDGGDELCLLYSRDLGMVALHDVTHDTVLLLEPQAMARLSGAFLAWTRGLSLNRSARRPTQGAAQARYRTMCGAAPEHRRPNTQPLRRHRSRWRSVD